MDAVLIVASGKEAADTIAKVLVPRYCQRSVPVTSASAARRTAAERECDLVVINAPLPDEDGEELAVWLADNTAADVLLLAGNELADAVHRLPPGVVALGKPLNRAMLEQTVRILDAARTRLAHLQQENRKLALKLEEARLVGRAKCALIEYRHLTESEAHRLIEKEAMDNRLPRREVAKDILRTFEG